MKILVTGQPLPGQNKLYLVWCPKCNQQVRIGEKVKPHGGTGGLIREKVDHCPHCHMNIELILPGEMGA